MLMAKNQSTFLIIALSYTAGLTFLLLVTIFTKQDLSWLQALVKNDIATIPHSGNP